MLIPAIIFVKKILPSNLSQVQFSIENNKLVEFDLAKYSPTQFAEKNNLIRHDKFDWHVNKLKPICYTFEKEIHSQQEVLPSTFDVFENPVNVQWLIFPLAVKQVRNGTHRNLIQLSVQYISYGMIDESVIAADYDEEWLKTLK